MKITILKDHKIYQESEGIITDISLEKGKEIEVDEKWIETLIAEGVITVKQEKTKTKLTSKGE